MNEPFEPYQVILSSPKLVVGDDNPPDQYSLRNPEEIAMVPSYCLWMYDSPRTNLYLEIWKKTWIIWKKQLSNVYEHTVVDYLFDKWGVHIKNKKTDWYKTNYFPSDMMMITDTYRNGVRIKIKQTTDISVFTGFVLNYIETQRIVWLNLCKSHNLQKIHYDAVNKLYIYCKCPPVESVESDSDN